MTDGWATGSGVAVERPATREYLGSAVLSRIEAARGSQRPLVLSVQEHAGSQRGLLRSGSGFAQVWPACRRGATARKSGW